MVMFAIPNFEPWVGPNYSNARRKILVVGESRDDEEYTDKTIIEDVCSGQGGKTFTNFMQAVTGVHHSDPKYDPHKLWDSAIFYNYNTTFFPGRPRIPLDWHTRFDKRNQRALRSVIEKYKPTHGVVWGKWNWESVAVEGHEWAWHQFLNGPRHDCEYCSVTVGMRRTLFTFIQHPSTAFSASQWQPLLKRFLSL
jgi:hypothetical protein